MKTIVRLNTIILFLLTTPTYAQVQELDFRGADNLYDMMRIYYDSGNADLPDSLKGAINKEIERTFET